MARRGAAESSSPWSSDQHPIPDGLLARDPVARGRHPRTEAVLIDPAADRSLRAAHVPSDGP